MGFFFFFMGISWDMNVTNNRNQYLVGGLEHFFHILGIVIPTD